MSTQIPPESLAAIRTLFYGRIAETNRDIIRALIDLVLLINEREPAVILSLLMDVENRIQAMQTILRALEECLES